MLWFGNKEIFWSWVYWGTGILTIIIFLFILSKKQNKKRKDNLIKDIERLSLKDNVNNFINRSGMEKGRDAWKYIGYGFNRDKMNIFLKTLKEYGLKIKNIGDLEYILTNFINKKEEYLLRGEINNDQKEFKSLNGTEFELLLVRLFDSMGYVVEHCGKKGDQGGNLVLNKGPERILAQAKRYTDNIGNGAVQKTVVAKKYYDCSKSMLIGSASFTSGAIELAKINNVRLLGKKELQELIQKNLKESWK
ncbi:MAG: Putative endonuclease related to Holliday junction resolvase [Parcubacteria bacterium 34_609]|nr:MAG: Putative endonuclease related to Holliday junction resolvase [Parcubacteria bacterium 34_609]KUK99441.1 MAG: Putative endonuclease related to Holliday junction resolvase [Parcubacteria bacterium 32_520]